MPAQTGTTITMPQLGESVTEGTIGNWLKHVGERIEKYEPLVEVETDKASAEIPAPLAGVLAEIMIEPGTVVPVGAVLCRIDVAESAAPTPESSPSGDIHGSNGHGAPAAHRGNGQDGGVADEAHLLRTRSSPVVRRMAEEHGIDISQIEGTGIDGRVTKKDILAFVARASLPAEQAAIVLPDNERASNQPVPSELSATRTPERSRAEPAPIGATAPLYAGDEVIPVTSMRRRIAAHMVESVQTAPQATVVMEVDMTRAVSNRALHKDAFERRETVPLTYLPFVIKSVTTALREHPRLNAVWDDERIIERRALNIGVAVGLDDGLVVPVIRNADRLSIAGLAHAVADLAAQARANAFTADDLAGGTFTINNPGTFGSLVSTPILVPPQVAILSTEAIIKRPVVVDDMIAIRSMMNLSLTIDHRALDGLAATRFLRQVRHWLEAINDELPLY